VFTLPEALKVGGYLDAHDDLTVCGQVHGEIWADGRLVVVASGGLVSGQIVALDVTVEGTVTGVILASGAVEILPGGVVEGRIVSPEVVPHEGSRHTGPFQPQRVVAAFRVARHRHAAGEDTLSLEP
jgi:cytoskeletal protein CcmA (bactofilin family)